MVEEYKPMFRNTEEEIQERIEQSKNSNYTPWGTLKDGTYNDNISNISIKNKEIEEESKRVKIEESENPNFTLWGTPK